MTSLPMTTKIDLYWSFRSPYSYIATPRLMEIERDFAVRFIVKPVMPAAVRDPGFFDRKNPLWPSYTMLDVARLAEFHGMTFAAPRPDPIVQDFAAHKVAEDQPYIYRLTRLGVAAEGHGRGLGFLYEVSKIIWDGTVDGWPEGDHLAGAAERAGLDLSALDAEIEADPGPFDQRIDQNQKDLQAAGQWGVPTMVLDGETFWGQDRIFLLRWRLEQQRDHE